METSSIKLSLVVNRVNGLMTCCKNLTILMESIGPKKKFHYRHYYHVIITLHVKLQRIQQSYILKQKPYHYIDNLSRQKNECTYIMYIYHYKSRFSTD